MPPNAARGAPFLLRRILNPPPKWPIFFVLATLAVISSAYCLWLAHQVESGRMGMTTTTTIDTKTTTAAVIKTVTVTQTYDGVFHDSAVPIPKRSVQILLGDKLISTEALGPSKTESASSTARPARTATGRAHQALQTDRSLSRILDAFVTPHDLGSRKPVEPVIAPHERPSQEFLPAPGPQAAQQHPHPGTFSIVGDTGVPVMHAALLPNGKVNFLDKVENFTKLLLENGQYAYSAEYNPVTRELAPLSYKVSAI